MPEARDTQFIQCRFVTSTDQVKTSNDRLSVDVVALYISGGDGHTEKVPDFVFQEQRQSPDNGEDETVRNVAATSPSSLDMLERGQFPPRPKGKVQPGTEKDEVPRARPYLISHRSSRKLPITDRKINWLADVNGQLFKKALQPLIVSRIIGVSIDLKRISNMNFAQAAKEVGNELRKLWLHYFGRPIVFLCHGFATFFLKDVLEANEDLDLRSAIAAIGMFGVDPKDRVISELKSWTAEHRCNMNPQSLLFTDNCQDDFGKALDNLRKDYFVSVFAFRTGLPSGRTENMFFMSDRDPIWSGGSLDQIATFSGPMDTKFRGMCNYIMESVEGHQLLTAALKNDHRMIMALIRRGANIDSINYTSRDHRTALAVAAEAGHVETVRILSTKDYVNLDHGVDGGTSALHCAVQSIRNLISGISQAEIDEADEYHHDTVTQILGRLKNGGLPLDDQITSLDISWLNHQVKQLARTIKVVEILLEAGALPTRGLVNTLKVQNPLEKTVKEFLSNPPAVQGPSPRRLEISTPSEQALKVCRDTAFVIREVFSAGEDKKDRHIPIYTNINQVIYQKKPSSEKLTNDPDPEFNIDDEFSRRRENLKEADTRLLCRWYHIPMNNMAWVHDLFAKLGIHVWPWPQGYRDYNPRSRAVYPQFVKPKPLIANTTESSPVVHAIMRYRNLITGMLESRFFGQPDEDEDAGEIDEIYRRFRGQTREDRWMYRLMKFSGYQIFSPLGQSHFDFSETYRQNRRHTSAILAMTSEQSTFVPQTEALTNAYLNYKHDSGYKLPLHPRLTLDQAHYYMLRDTTYRDQTQVVSRWFRRNRKVKAREHSYTRAGQALFEEEDHNILMVDQLWIWLIKDEKSDHEADATREKVTLVTSFPDRFGTKSAARNNIAQQVFRDNTRDSFQNVSDLVRQIISVCLRTFKEASVDGYVSFLQCFEISLVNLEEQSAQRFSEFRRLSEILERLDDKHPDYLSRRRLPLNMLLRIGKDSKILSEVKDVLDEIGMIQGVLQAQEKVLSHDGELQHLLGETRDRGALHNELRSMIETLDQMKQRTQSVVDSVEKLLDMKQRHVNLWEARISREGSELAGKAGNTLWWFTVVTIIFLPLSFMASFFALDIDQFPKDADGDTNWPLDSVISLLFGISLAVIIPLYFLAFFSENLQRTWSMIRCVWMPLILLPMTWALNKLPFLHMSLLSRSIQAENAVKKYDPKFEQFVESLVGKNGTEVIDDDDDVLDEEDGLIRDWRRYYNNPWGIF